MSPNTTYNLDVAAYNAAGTTWANSQSATTLSKPTAPSAPFFMAMAVSATQINLVWTPVAGATGYQVDKLINGVWKQIGSLGSGSTGYAVTGLSPNTTYYFNVALTTRQARPGRIPRAQPHSRHYRSRPSHSQGISTSLLQTTRMATTTTTQSSMARCLVPTGRHTPMSTRP